MTNKALRLPIILLALLVMGGVIQQFRPKQPLEAKPFRDASSIQTFDITQTPGNLSINGHNPSDISTLQAAYRPLSLQQSWSPTDIQRIEAKGNKRILVFTDGSMQEVTPSIFKQLPASIQVRLSYHGPK